MNREIKFKFYEKDPFNKWRVMYEMRACGGINDFFRTRGSMEKCQFTGLKDKNDREIYEGDIVEDLNTTMKDKYKVVYNSNTASFQIVSIWNDSAEPFFFYGVSGSNDGGGVVSTKPTISPIVIGNVFESPELLKV